MNTVDLGTLPPALGDRPTQRAPRGWLFAFAAIALVTFGMVVEWALPTPARADEPLLMLQAEGGQGTAIIWYADGTREDGGRAFATPWRPSKPVRMVTVAAAQACSITVNEQLVVDEQAPVNRLAVCVWASPAS